MSSSAFEKWVFAYEQNARDGSELLWPSETLVRLFKGSYVPGIDRSAYAGKRVLDVGHGNGNNLIFLGLLGLELAGTEVNEQICRNTAAKLERLGYSSDLRVGTNRQLPFPDNHFEFLVSWNVIHYENTADEITSAIMEYRRVLRQGGRFFISTTAPDHKILLGARRVGPHQYQIGRNDDFRKGQVFFYFDDESTIHSYFDPHFDHILIGRTHDHLFSETLDWFIITGVKGLP